MALEIPQFKETTDTAKLIQWIVFIVIIIILGWCFWFYYDTDTKLQASADSNVNTSTSINKARLDKIIATQEGRDKQFNTPIIIKYDPLQ